MKLRHRFRVCIHLRGGGTVKFLARKFNATTEGAQVTEAKWTSIAAGHTALMSVNPADIAAITWKDVRWIKFPERFYKET